MKVLALADESTFIAHRKYLRWPMNLYAFFPHTLAYIFYSNRTKLFFTVTKIMQ